MGYPINALKCAFSSRDGLDRFRILRGGLADPCDFSFVETGEVVRREDSVSPRHFGSMDLYATLNKYMCDLPLVHLRAM